MRGIDQNSPYYKEFHELTTQLRKRVYALRTKKGLTQEDMQNYGLSLRQYQRIESGETKNITLANLYKLGKAFDIAIHELLDL